jgi:hypothetical protein
MNRHYGHLPEALRLAVDDFLRSQIDLTTKVGSEPVCARPEANTWHPSYAVEQA